jgi:hypothetical protein
MLEVVNAAKVDAHLEAVVAKRRDEFVVLGARGKAGQVDRESFAGDDAGGGR